MDVVEKECEIVIEIFCNEGKLEVVLFKIVEGCVFVFIK